ncbi:AAA family ATPase [Bacillus sp. es.034]|uniref:AAA family ATPase n=1 Tax=Bacillus sp. es.034 TaxID=1761763 RepID=UPI000BFA435B|nr:AAA family ATPase [Bacillus sp. es.034]PFG05246.1 putative ATP-dependent endonuclease of OLD family [Bacillus sp. es.034]
MIIGLLCRHYKIYQGLNFVPICNDYENPFALFIGNNAVGKSSVLESLNTFFNNGNWNRTKNTKADEAFIAPVFLIRKDEIKDNISDKYYQILSNLSDYFWNIKADANGNLKNNDGFLKFFQFRDELKYKYGQNEYLFFLLGMDFNEKSKVYYSTFTTHLDNKLKELGIDCRDIMLISIIKEYYSYIYIPVESITSEVIKIENKEMQDLMSTDILEEIDNILNDKTFTKQNGTTRKVSLMEYLNTNLDEYMNTINHTIGLIDENYAYKVEHGYKKNLTPLDVRSRILEAYFSIRTLKKDKKEIYELSSGEQRIALIDIATAFLQNNTKTNKRKVILAIDEPENSLHISKAFGQFDRLHKLVGENQLILTTHWYGSLPITSVGNVQHLDDKIDGENKVNINSFDLNNYFEKRGSLPEDIQMKSYFDLTASILSSIRSDKCHWIICEGSDDKLYLSHYLNEVENLRLLSVGGCGNVIKIYRYLFTPFLEKEEKKAIESKVLCLIDTDDIMHDIEISSDIKGKLKLARIQPDRTEKVKLQAVSKSGFYNPTEMEDCLNPLKYFNSVKEVILGTDDENLKRIFSKFKFKEGTISSRIKPEELSILEPTELVPFDEKKQIFDFLDDHYNKFLIAKKYTSQERGELPELFVLIKKYLED